MRHPDDVFNLLRQMREARPGQRIATQVPLNLNVDQPAESDDGLTPARRRSRPGGIGRRRPSDRREQQETGLPRHLIAGRDAGAERPPGLQKRFTARVRQRNRRRTSLPPVAGADE